MRCQECKDLVWDIDCEETSHNQRQSILAHCAQCQDCRDRLAEARNIQAALRSPVNIDIRSLSLSVLDRVYDQIEQEKVVSPSFGSWRPLAGFLAMAATALFAIITLAPNETTALTIDKLTSKHRICVAEGHYKNYRCDTEAAFAELAMSELGLTPQPFELPAATFMKGDICDIGGNRVAHALFKVKGETVSYFRLYGIGEKVKQDKGWVKHSVNVWTMERQGHLVTLRRFAENDYGLYTGKVAFSDLEQVWKQAVQ